MISISVILTSFTAPRVVLPSLFYFSNDITDCHVDLSDYMVDWNACNT